MPPPCEMEKMKLRALSRVAQTARKGAGFDSRLLTPKKGSFRVREMDGVPSITEASL